MVHEYVLGMLSLRRTAQNSCSSATSLFSTVLYETTHLIVPQIGLHSITDLATMDLLSQTLALFTGFCDLVVYYSKFFFVNFYSASA